MIPFVPLNKKFTVFGWLVLLSWVLLTYLSFRLTPNLDGHGTHTQLGLGACPAVFFFRRPCPACGLTTSWAHLTKGHFLDSLGANPFGIPFYIGFTLFTALWVFGLATKQHPKILSNPRLEAMFSGFMSIFIVFGILRAILVHYPH